MEIKRLKGARFGTERICQIVTGWALFEKGRGYLAFSAQRDKYGILAPYIPCGGFSMPKRNRTTGKTLCYRLDWQRRGLGK